MAECTACNYDGEALTKEMEGIEEVHEQEVESLKEQIEDISSDLESAQEVIREVKNLVA